MAKKNIIEGEFVACAHRVTWWYDCEDHEVTDELRERLENEAEERARHCIAEDYVSGELCCLVGGEHELRGWWDIVRN